MSDRRSEIAIAGAGIAGLAAALAFRKAGYSVTVLEQTASLGAVGAGILIQANGLLVLDALGLGAEVRAAGVSLPRFLLRDRHGRVLVESELGAHLPAHLLPVSIHRADLHEILWRACASMDVKLDLGCKVIFIETNGRLPILVCDTPGGSARVAADLVVGADGVHSVVRELGGFSPRFWSAIEGSVQGVAPFPVPGDCHGEYVGGGQACGLLPMGGAKTFWFWGGSGKTVTGIADLTFASWKESVCRNFPAMRLVLDERHEWSGAVRLIHRSVQCEKWSAGHVVLIGDAAHAMSPNLGQGANCALVDALALVCHIASLARDANLSNVLGRFEGDRRSMVARLQRRGHREGIVGVQGWPGVERLFNFTLRLARYTSAARQRAEVHMVSGLTGNGFDLAAAGITAPIPWQDTHTPPPLRPKPSPAATYPGRATPSRSFDGDEPQPGPDVRPLD